jgi:hypothetical protein
VKSGTWLIVGLDSLHNDEMERSGVAMDFHHRLFRCLHDPRFRLLTFPEHAWLAACYDLVDERCRAKQLADGAPLEPRAGPWWHDAYWEVYSDVYRPPLTGGRLCGESAVSLRKLVRVHCDCLNDRYCSDCRSECGVAMRRREPPHAGMVASASPAAARTTGRRDAPVEGLTRHPQWGGVCKQR